MKPKRIQRKRTKGWRMPANTIYVGRPTKWGNPFHIKDGWTRQEAVEQYAIWIDEEPEKLQEIKNLAGKDLACWCRIDGFCHADVLLRLANERTMDLTKCGCEIEPGAWLYAECEHGLRWIYNYGKLEIDHQSMQKPTVVCLCGSTRFSEAFQDANLKETLFGKIVLTIGCDTKGDDELFAQEFMAPDELANLKNQLDILHFRKIDMADEVLILNINGYIGESTARELTYARSMGKKVRFLEGSDDEN